VTPRELFACLGRHVAERAELGEVVEVADEVLAPVAEAGHRDAGH
jgi:hypothetical protein